MRERGGCMLAVRELWDGGRSEGLGLMGQWFSSSYGGVNLTSRVQAFRYGGKG